MNAKISDGMQDSNLVKYCSASVARVTIAVNSSLSQCIHYCEIDQHALDPDIVKYCSASVARVVNSLLSQWIHYCEIDQHALDPDIVNNALLVLPE